MLKYSLKLIYYYLVILYLNSTLKNKIKQYNSNIYLKMNNRYNMCVLMYYSYDKLFKYLKCYLNASVRNLNYFIGKTKL